MPTLKKFPWVSLGLLLVTYGALGWLLSAFHDPVFVWVMTIVSILLLNTFLSSPWLRISNGFTSLFSSDARAFFFAVLAAFLIVLIITWLHVFAHALVIASAGTLFKLDAQTAGLSGAQTFLISSIVSLTGLGIGAVMQTLM